MGELNGKPLVVKNTFIDCAEVHPVPTFAKINTAPAACQGNTTTADLPEHDVHDEPFDQRRHRLLNIAEVGNTDACSCCDASPSHSDACEVASSGSTNVPSELSLTLNVCGSDTNGVYPPSCSGYLPRQDCSALNSYSHPMGIHPWVSYQGIVAGETRDDMTALMFRNLPE